MADPIAQLRVLIPDDQELFGPNEDQYMFSDDDLNTFLELASSNVLRAAALAVETIATSEALISKVITTQDLQTDGSKVANSLLARAKQLRDQADKDETTELNQMFDLIPTISHPPYWGY